ncbi:hypothetical protein PABG_06746 [Paracoccidioides brasiliensis Pb03]|uniref:Autophagy-related protein 101 n=1 Tax=Paracoccidioides brasiliensis TaxID=121759 RepID=A0A1D2JPL3_PARBR|nr:hypothetical protein PABG_06746 [Paracoccidioides brasiliensis Pb03]ODH45123.1 hypothetical protein ACO22_00327 [Paracoccidioides brasiliensis]ODH51591.1 hypothetical protein GX48_02260 [Paracoccidioides brasiliensis]
MMQSPKLDPRKPPEHILEVFADPTSVKEIVKGILHTIFFHRYFPCIRPTSLDVLNLTLPAINDVELETLIDARVNALIRQHLSSSANGPNGGVRGRIAVQFFEKRRRKVGGMGVAAGAMWLVSGLAGRGASGGDGDGGSGGVGAGMNEEEVCWEVWTVNVTIATPRTESDRTKVRKAMEKMLQKAVFKILAVVNKEKDHIPPITTSDANPFPYQIVLNPKLDSWGNKFGLY